MFFFVAPCNELVVFDDFESNCNSSMSVLPAAAIWKMYHIDIQRKTEDLYVGLESGKASVIAKE